MLNKTWTISTETGAYACSLTARENLRCNSNTVNTTWLGNNSMINQNIMLISAKQYGDRERYLA